MTFENPDFNPSEDAANLTPEKPRKNGMATLSWYLLVLGFIAIVLAALCFFLYRNRPLSYNDFSINANVLGRYLLTVGLVCYVIGRAIQYVRRFKAHREDF